MSSPWSKLDAVEAVNLTEIMSEEVARNLQEKENKISLNTISPIGDEFVAACKMQNEGNDNEELKSDAEIAMMLQQQYDKEYDLMLKKHADKYNKDSKVSINFKNFQRAPLNPDFESSSEYEEEPEDPEKDWDRFDGVQRDYAAIKGCGYGAKNGIKVTKHDGAINGRRNACKMMSFPPNFETGDGAGFDLQLSNRVFNSLRLHSKDVELRRYRTDEQTEQRATANFSVDQRTRMLLYGLINNNILELVNGEVSIGKEAVVLHGERVANPEVDGANASLECAIKVFKTTLSEYKQREKYIRDDFRFKDRMHKQNTKRMIQLWAEKEMRNLIRLQAARIPAPTVVKLKQHILVMSFIGKCHKPALKLKEISLTDSQWIDAYNQVLNSMKKMYHVARLIHADLSEYNILWFEGTCYIIDVSQSVEPSHENAFHFLMRDCKNINKFFDKRVPEVLSAEEMFKTIVGCDFGDRIALMALEKNFKMKPYMVDEPNMNLTESFDRAWERAQSQSNDATLPQLNVA